jgi:hypothetical protein
MDIINTYKISYEEEHAVLKFCNNLLKDNGVSSPLSTEGAQYRYQCYEADNDVNYIIFLLFIKLLQFIEVQVFHEPNLYFYYRPLLPAIQKHFFENPKLVSDLKFSFEPQVFKTLHHFIV